MVKLAGLSAAQARGTLMARLAGTAARPGVIDRARQIAVNMGARPYRVELVWTTWTGAERGEGTERELARLELLPSPQVTDLTSVALNAFSAGKLPVGSVRLSEVSAGRYTEDLLRGLRLPDGSRLDERKNDFYFDVHEDGRNLAPDELAERKRFRVMAGPHLSSCCTQYSIVLERASKDPNRMGAPPGGPSWGMP